MPEHPSAESPGKESPELLAARVQLLYDNANPANLAVLITAVLLALLLMPVIPDNTVYGWLLSITGLASLRLLLVKQRERRPDNRSNIAWLKLYVSTTALVGLCWAAVPLWMMPTHSQPHQFLVIIFVFGLASAGIAVLQSSTAAMMLYTLPAMLALIGQLLWTGWAGDSGYSMVGLLILAAYPLTHIRAARNANRAIVDALQLGEQNSQLIEQLQAEISERQNAQLALENNQQQLETLVALRTAELEREIADRQLAQRDAEMAAEAAERANQAKSEFLANMSHELRTPMHAILSFAEMGHKRVTQLPAEKLATYFERISTSGQRLMHLLNELLDLARLEAGRVQLNITSVEIKPLLQSLCDELAPLAEQRQIRLDCTPLDEHLSLDLDESRVLQVLRNLVANAIKFSPEGGTVEIGCQAARLSHDGNERAALQISVADRGPGIPEDELQTIFERFIQSSATRTGAGGAGLGLAICREIVELHDGLLEAANRDGGGARFQLLLPLPATD